MLFTEQCNYGYKFKRYCDMRNGVSAKCDSYFYVYAFTASSKLNPD